ncbi:Tim44/TimA family putative adaptor protein [Altererythrobacter sp. ZODW24]|uniref:Tim44/TimA family putative adaptor protein n=1 Tax=Altererythrobacter sp. ZODW24 TaxID=2185142 RepID=UPI0013B38C22|nr:Tim44/TimA family putative adaptor protein [Altererythrobacter sp. ZODW24]
MIEIVILAMVAAFLGLRLYSVLGQRAEQEEEPPRARFEAPKDTVERKPEEQRVSAAAAPQVAAPQPVITGIAPAVEMGVREIAAADRSFDILGFLEGSKGAYAMVLEAFWEGDRETLRELCDDDVYEGFDGAIAAREESGEVLDNKLIRIEDALIHSADLNGRMARVAVRFVADIATVTRDKNGNVIGGSLDDAVESRDIWTFSRDLGAAGPDWILDETDEG